MCLENLAKFKDGEWRMCDVVTGDVLKISRFESKNLLTIFFRTSDVVHISYLDKKKDNRPSKIY